MITISLERAWRLLLNASAVVIEDTVVPIGIASLHGDPENEFLFLHWYEENGEEYYLKFTEGDNTKVEVSGSSMFLFDHDSDDDEPRQLTILAAIDVESIA